MPLYRNKFQDNIAKVVIRYETYITLVKHFEKEGFFIHQANTKKTKVVANAPISTQRRWRKKIFTFFV